MCETCVTGNTGLPGDHAQEAVMTSTLKKTETSEISVGSRVRTRHSVDRSGDRETWPLEGGVIVEDFAAYVEPASVNRDWAVAHRWAVALDNGCLVFRDTAELETENSEQSTGKQ